MYAGLGMALTFPKVINLHERGRQELWLLRGSQNVCAFRALELNKFIAVGLRLSCFGDRNLWKGSWM